MLLCFVFFVLFYCVFLSAVVISFKCYTYCSVHGVQLMVLGEFFAKNGCCKFALEVFALARKKNSIDLQRGKHCGHHNIAFSLIGSPSVLLVTRTSVKFRTSSISFCFGVTRPLTQICSICTYNFSKECIVDTIVAGDPSLPARRSDKN